MLWSEVPACQGQTRKSRIAIEFEFAYHCASGNRGLRWVCVAKIWTRLSRL